MELAPGVVVAESIRLVRRIGEGGMGSVWEARHENLETNVAIKILSAGDEERSETMIARFKREALAAGRIKSPHVVQIFDSGTFADGTPFIVMELLEGRNLGERIELDGPLPLDQLIPIVEQIAKALSKAHAIGVVHRDVKPENVFLLDEHDEAFVKVLDFGLAKQFDVKTGSVVTMTGTMVGTPAFMSPEQVLSGKSVDARADIWSLGVLAYNALTGEIPFEGETLGAMCVSIASGKFKPIRELEPSLPTAIEKWLARILAVDPDARFQSVREAADALKRAAEGVAPDVGKTIVMTDPDALGHLETAKGARALKGPVPLKTESVHLPLAGPSPRIVLGVVIAALAVVAAIALPITLSNDESSGMATTAPSAGTTDAPAPPELTPSTTPPIDASSSVSSSAVSSSAVSSSAVSSATLSATSALRSPAPPGRSPASGDRAPPGPLPSSVPPTKPAPVDRGF